VGGYIFDGQINGAKKVSPEDKNTKSDTSDCTSASATKGCTSKHTISAVDKEYWDLGMGISIPGVREPNYASSNPRIQTNPTPRTDVYAFVDIFPFASKMGKSSVAPSVAVGIPVTGKVFYTEVLRSCNRGRKTTLTADFRPRSQHRRDPQRKRPVQRCHALATIGSVPCESCSPSRYPESFATPSETT
jgi:hypothetical protein